MNHYTYYIPILILILCCPSLVWGASANEGALSDPAGEGRPTYRDQPTTTDMAVRFHLHGYYRLRWDVLHQLDLQRGPTPSTGQPVFPTPPGKQGPLNTGDMRLRLDLSLDIARSVRVVVRVDALDNLVLGSTPEGLPRTGQVPSIIATPSQNSPEAGRNAFLDAIRLRWAYGEVLLPFGYLAAGRMGALTPWGLGVLVQSGNDLDADVSDAGDRVLLGLALFGHLLLLAFDWSASGPIIGLNNGTSLNQDPRDDVRSYSIAFARYDTPQSIRRKLLAQQMVINYGLLFSYRHQNLDAPLYYENTSSQRPSTAGELVERNAWSFVLSAWFLLRTPWLRLELEAVYAQGEIANSSLVPGVRLTDPITSQQFGGALQFAVSPPAGRWGLGLEVSLASGDDAPGLGVSAASANQSKTQPGDIDGPQINYPADRTINNFRFHPSYRVDQIFWRRIVGQVSDAFYVKLAGHFDITSRLRLWTAALYSRTLFASSAPGNDNNLGVEWDTGLRYHFDPGFEIRFVFAAFFPFAGLRNLELQLEPQPALATHLVLGYIF